MACDVLPVAMFMILFLYPPEHFHPNKFQDARIMQHLILFSRQVDTIEHLTQFNRASWHCRSGLATGPGRAGDPV